MLVRLPFVRDFLFLVAVEARVAIRWLLGVRGEGGEVLMSSHALAVATLVTASQARTETLLFAGIPQ